MIGRLAAILVAAAGVAWPAAAAEPVVLFAAGSLRDAMTEVAQAFEHKTATKIQARFAPSGLLRDDIAAGTKADVFASANMNHPQALTAAAKSGPTQLFARNRLCALARPGLAVSSGGLLARMLEPNVKLATSTPKADPAGDYAFALFAKAEQIHPGAQPILAAKALKLTGAADSAAPPAGRNPYGWHVAEGRADLFLTYCTNAVVAARQNPGQQIIDIPADLTIGADYGLTVIAGAGPAAQDFADFVLSPPGQAILVRHGFSPAR